MHSYKSCTSKLPYSYQKYDVSVFACRPPPLCGATPAEHNYVCPTGSKVAARVRSDEAEENWILSEVIAFNSTTNRFDVDDIDAEDGKE